MVAVREQEVSSSNPLLADVVPTDEVFEMLEKLNPILRQMCIISNNFSKEKECIVSSGLVLLFRSCLFLEEYPAKVVNSPQYDSIKHFCTSLLFEMNKPQRFNDKGKNTYFYALGHLLHPYYKGRLLRDYKIYDEVVAKMIDEHPSTVDFYKKQKETQQGTQTSPSLLEDDDDDVMNLDSVLPEVEVEANTSLNIPELEREMKTYNNLPPCEEKHKVDVLQWWKKHARSIPLLSQIARDTLCIPMASATSERVFSASGSIVSDKRHNLATESVKKLLLIKVNYDIVKDSIKMKCVSPEEQMVDPPPPPAPKTPRKKSPVKPTQPTGKQTKIKFARKIPTSSSSTSSSQSPQPSTPSSQSPQPSTSAAARTPQSSTQNPTTPAQKRKALPPMQIRKRQKLDRASIEDMFNTDGDLDDDIDLDDEEYVPSEEY